MHSSHRVVYGSIAPRGHPLIPEILEIGWGNFVAADSGHLRPHAHEGAFEFCFIVSGEVEWATQESSYILREGDVYVTRPDEVHWGRDSAMHPCTLYWMIVGSLGCGYCWPNLDANLAAHLDGRLRDFRTHRLRGNPKLGIAFKEIFEEHASQRGDGDLLMLQQGRARAALHSLLIDVLRAYDNQSPVAASSSDFHALPSAAARVIDLLRNHAGDPDAVRSTCRTIGIEYPILNRQFVEHLGTSLSQYWLRERIRLAREQLRQRNATITKIATDLGFSSSQHFATLFRKITGLTPSEYRGAGFESGVNPDVHTR